MKFVAVSTMVALGGMALAHDALAWGRFKDGQYVQGKSATSEFDDRGRRLIYDRKGRRVVTPVCRSTDLDCCDR